MQGIVFADFGFQLLPDGRHFERSPMYHAILLEALLDLIGLARVKVNRGVLRWLSHGDERAMAISVVTIGEIEKGIAWMPQGKRQRALEVWLQARPQHQPRLPARR